MYKPYYIHSCFTHKPVPNFDPGAGEGVGGGQNDLANIVMSYKLLSSSDPCFEGRLHLSTTDLQGWLIVSS